MIGLDPHGQPGTQLDAASIVSCETDLNTGMTTVTFKQPHGETATRLLTGRVASEFHDAMVALGKAEVTITGEGDPMLKANRGSHTQAHKS